jgi:NAD(P)-dependent dehydrogenase (short-subunit alcohol dehydrogenase family)
MSDSASTLAGKTILITGAARRIGRALALAAAHAGADLILHHSASPDAAEETRKEIEDLGRRAHVLQADFADPHQVQELVPAANRLARVDALVNNAAIFEAHTWRDTGLEAWDRHLAINLTAPFLLSQAFAASLPAEAEGRIVNILDWRALRPGDDHLPYTISKAGLAALTRSLAVALAPRITVNGLALGAILPPSSGGDLEEILAPVPARRWADISEVQQAFLFLLTGPAYITGEILHLDGGRHLV